MKVFYRQKLIQTITKSWPGFGSAMSFKFGDERARLYGVRWTTREKFCRLYADGADKECRLTDGGFKLI
ncbi:MAG: hypothetical protein H6766_04250 [Candidatus Peribacteria bacterium]|nr:MAG: hypothetical protein H6766_04250 [Candidatus Peribacteria bacterium]